MDMRDMPAYEVLPRWLPAFESGSALHVLTGPRGFPLFFLLSKTLGTMLLPTNFLIGVGLVGVLLLASRFASLGRKLLTASLVLVALCAFSPLGNWLLYPLEQRFPPWDAARGAPDGILVLGGGMDSNRSAERGTAVFSSSAGRVLAAVALAHRYPKAKILYSGGEADLVAHDAIREADLAPAVFASLGISADRLMLERQSRNTFENAAFSKAVVLPKDGERWLLVTSAYHMPRSVGIFRKAGFAIEPCPVDWRLGGASELVQFSAFSSDGLQRMDLAAREWIGLLAYWLTGKTSALFPGPQPE
jgi:uncharacterized SAM-binding protein YcdF (DUF218 family)